MQPGDPERIGPYRLVRELGSGGMGRVFLARSSGGRPVAVKVIRPDLAADPEFRARFRHEVAAARLVNGLYTALVIDADVDGPVPWLATAYVAGPSLADKVRQQGPLAAGAVEVLAAGLAEGLGAIHAAGLVHRDLKPSNVLLADDGPRVIDFGISRAVEASALTSTGLVVGSPGFMSPEQAVGIEVGPPSDVFSLGAVLTFACTGHGPFGTGSAPALGYRVVHAQADLAGVPSEIRFLIERCLAKDPGERPSIAEMLAELGDFDVPEDWLSPVSPGEPAQNALANTADGAEDHLPGGRPAERAGDVSAGASPTAPAWAGGAFAGHGAPAGDARTAGAVGAADSAEAGVRAPVAAATPTMEAQPGPALEVTESMVTPVPRAAAVTSPRRHLTAAARLRMAASTPRIGIPLAVALAAVIGISLLAALPASRPSTAQPPATKSAHRPASSASATSFPPATSSDTAAPPVAALIATLTNPGGFGVGSVAISPNGTTLAVSHGGINTYLWNTTTRKVTATLPDPAGAAVNSVAFSPSGTTLATGDFYGNTYLWNLATRKVTAAFTGPANFSVSSVAFSPSGTALAIADNDAATANVGAGVHGSTYLWNVASHTVTATLTDPPGAYGLIGPVSVAFSPNGTTLAIGDVSGSTYLWSLAIRKVTATLTDPTNPNEETEVNSVAFSPDGATLAVGGNTESTYLWNLASRTVIATLNDPGGDDVKSVAFSPGGTTLATGDANDSTYLWNLATRKVTAALTEPTGTYVDSVAYSPGGTTLAVADDNGSTFLWRLPTHAA